ncbi:MAG: methylaspartate ammonia-lyase [Desulfovibrio sp.]|jgi:methylaspartate ammonia-lyase|nr:methylaspartate ammonia-lyase [Desulfovibrio sp.]
MKVSKLIVAPGLGGYYFDDLEAVKRGARADGYFILGTPVTEGHKKVRNPGETISIMLQLDSGDIALGSCVAIQYSGVVGRDPILLPERYIPVIEQHVMPKIEGREITTFKETAEWFDNITVDGKKLHTGIRYGITQAILAAVAIRDKLSEAEVVAREYGTVVSDELIPILAQSSDLRYLNVDKMIIKKVPAIPQGLFNQVDKVGEQGEKLEEYCRWLAGRVKEFGDPDYFPLIHLDVYGIPGKIFNNDPGRLAEYFAGLEKIVLPYHLDIECPVDAGTRDGTMEVMVKLAEELKKLGSKVDITADDWCNTLDDIKFFVDNKAADMIQIKTPDLGSIHNSIEAVLYCKKAGVKAFLGGTCNGTDISSRATVNMAMATRADMVYNKPGMGVDEGYMIVHNEMRRILAILKAKNYWG